MSDALTSFAGAFVSLFAIVDPLGTAAAFAGLRARELDATRDALGIALRATLLATLLLGCAAVLGARLIARGALDLDALRLASGALLLLSAWPMLRRGAPPLGASRNLALFPLTIPLLAGPGCMATIVALGASGGGARLASVLLALLGVQTSAFICLLTAPRLLALLGPRGVSVAVRFTALWLSAIALRSLASGGAVIFSAIELALRT